MSVRKPTEESADTQAHTPGPWEFDAHEWAVIKRDGDPGHILIADMDFAACGDDNAEVVANARLIAAAPDLLAIAEAVAGHFHEGSPFGERARAIIAKIEGRS